MAEKAAEAGAPPQTPLTDDRLAALWNKTIQTDPAHIGLAVRLDELRALIDEVRRHRARMKAPDER